jgi:hypothetical protein
MLDLFQAVEREVEGEGRVLPIGCAGPLHGARAKQRTALLEGTEVDTTDATI